MKNFTVTLEIEAPNKEAVERMLDGIPHGERIWDEEIKSEDDRYYEARIRYEENGRDGMEYYIFESKWSNEDEWGTEIEVPLLDYKDEKAVLVHFQALTRIREWQKLGIPFHFA